MEGKINEIHCNRGIVRGSLPRWADAELGMSLEDWIWQSRMIGGNLHVARLPAF